MSGRSTGHRAFHISFSPLSFAAGAVAVLIVIYIGLIAAVMGYAALTVEFSQSVRNDEASVADLEEQYLAAIGRITTTDYAAAGYAKPAVQIFVRAKSVTALR